MSDIITPPIEPSASLPKPAVLLFSVVLRDAQTKESVPLADAQAEALAHCREQYWVRKEISADFFLKKQPTISENRPFRSKLETAIAELHRAATDYQLLLISSFRPFEYESSLPLFELLSNSDIPFRFIDFPAFDKHYIRIHIQYLKKKRESQSVRPVDTVATTATEHHLNDEYTRLISRRKKIQTAYLSPFNLPALRSLRQATDWPKAAASPTRAARHLQTNNILTARGNTHSPKTASRLTERLLHLSQTLAFTPILKYHSLCSLPLNAPLPTPQKMRELPVRLDNEIPDAAERISFLLQQPCEQDVTVTIFTHSLLYFQTTKAAHSDLPDEPQQVYQWEQTFAPPVQQIDIDIVHDTALLPGIHYARFRARNYHDTWRCFTVLASLR